MKRNRKLVLGTVFILIAAMIIPFAASAKGILDVDHPASLAVECVYDGSPLSGVTFTLHKVADVDSYGRYTLTGKFVDYEDSIVLEQEDAEGWRALAETLTQYARRDGIEAVKEETTEAEGIVSFEELSVGMYLVYGSRYTDEDLIYTPEPFLISLPSLDENDDWYYDIEATCKGIGELIPKTSIKVLKVWDDKGYESDRPEEISVQLLRNGKVYETVALNEDNNWRYTWDNLLAEDEWTVIEEKVPEKYTLLVTNEGSTFVLTNTYKQVPPPPPPPDIPQTGQLWWPIPVFVGLALMCYLIGYLQIKAKKSVDE